MNPDTAPHLSPAPCGVSTLAQANAYFRKMQREYFMGLPGVGLGAEAYAVLRQLFDLFRRAAPDDSADLWILATDDGGMFIATHLHCPRPGRAFAAYLERQSLCDLGTRFAARWSTLQGYYDALRSLYVLSDQAEPGETAEDANVHGCN